ncbi:hypothetical protein [Pseudactinotalea sp. Z1732]|uniref:hypothetical protein n=1 Tax=Micrococcales TaxID=85006 RepID=UPI003C7EB70D
MSRFRFPSLSQLLGLGRDEPTPHADAPVEDFLDPYTAGRQWRQESDTPIYDATVLATGTLPGGESR